MKTRVNKKSLIKLMSIFLSLLLLVTTLTFSTESVFAEDYNTPEMTIKTNSKKHLTKLIKNNKELKQEVENLSNKGFKLNDEYFVIEEVEVLVYSNQEETIQGLIQIVDDEYTVLEVSVNNNGDVQSAFLKDENNQKMSLDFSNDEIVFESSDGTIDSAFLKDENNQKMSLDAVMDKIALADNKVKVNSDYVRNVNDEEISLDIANEHITLEMNEKDNGNIQLYGKAEKLICTLLIQYSGASIALIAKMVATALSAGPAVLAAIAVLKVVGPAYAGLYC